MSNSFNPSKSKYSICIFYDLFSLVCVSAVCACLHACLCLPCVHVCVLLLKHFETHQLDALKYMSGCGRWGVCIDQRTALLCWLSASTFMCFPEGELSSLNLLGKCLYLLSHLDGPVVWSFLWSGGEGHRHRHPRMHAHVHTPHVLGVLSGTRGGVT